MGTPERGHHRGETKQGVLEIQQINWFIGSRITLEEVDSEDGERLKSQLSGT
jgi:hypothetical protein